MANFKTIFRDTTALYNQGGSFAGAASIGAWADVFKNMRDRLVAEGATAEEHAAFREALLDGIAAAPDSDLSADERMALRNIVLTTFDGVSWTHGITLALKAQFLRYVNF